MSTESTVDDVSYHSKYGVLSKKEIFKWCIHASSLVSSDVSRRSDFFSFGPSSNAKFCLMLPSTDDSLSKPPFCSTSQFSVFLYRVWDSKIPKKGSDDRVKVSFSLLDLRDRLHHTCERILLEDDRVQANFDRNCYEKYHLTFLRNGFIVINCALDVDEVIQEDSIPKENLPLVSFTDELSTLDLVDDFSTLIENGQHSDVTLTVKGKDFRAHRAILSARSPVFSAMFEHDTLEKETNLVEISDVSSDAMAHLLRFLYTGQTDQLSVEAALDLFIASDKYALPKLKKKCSNYLSANLSSDILLKVLTVANMHEDENLKNAAIQEVLCKAVQVMKSQEWLLFLKEYPELANSIILQLALRTHKE